MQPKLSLFFSLALTSLALLLELSCAKVDSPAASVRTTLQNGVHTWYDEFSKHASPGYKKNADQVIADINYNDAAIVTPPGKDPVYVIGTGAQKYLALTKHNDEFQAMGIFHAPNLQQVEHFILQPKLAPGDSMTIYSFANKPATTWLTTTDGRSRIKVVQNVASLNNPAQPVANGNNTFTTFSDKMHANSYEAPKPCTDWYYITYDLETGYIVGYEYLYTTCPDEDGSGGGSKTDAQELADCQARTNKDIANDHTESVSEGSEELVNAGLTRTRAYHWKIFSGVGWHLVSHETGVHAYSKQDKKWHWLSLTHSSISTVGTWGGGEIKVSLNTATSTVLYDSPVAGMELNYNVLYTFDCVGKKCNSSKDYNTSVLIEINQTVNDI